ncbi:hypothetical protein [Metallosphaera hakonensis]|uniref:Uncharacterized protein n=1 Tax=Metallosphaera hakonensis JCM 8857 = DSM 7519 TaxID=1293036 RepID=A0A2U9IW69_9CREN|nr:hypothetical protein [Metallosphaera hakonensis]AWS00213.1 hypothetical protein DFR87_11535 [Metallosphaera hakonensis JCM 8857 = DSM 7519]
MIEVVLFAKLALLIIGIVSSVYGIGYVIIGKFNIPFIPRRDSMIIGSMLIGIALALFIVTAFIP